MANFRRPFRAPPLWRRPDNVLHFEPKLKKRRQPRQLHWWKRNWAVAVLLAAPLIGIGIAWLWQAASADGPHPQEPVVEQYQLRFERCSGSVRTTCVVDGDTFWLEGTKIRIADINTPEVSDPQCGAELALGERATNRLVTLLNEDGFSLEAVNRDEDDFGRKLRIVTRGGESLGTILVAEGLAEAWTGSRRSWC